MEAQGECGPGALQRASGRGSGGEVLGSGSWARDGGGVWVEC